MMNKEKQLCYDRVHMKIASDISELSYAKSTPFQNARNICPQPMEQRFMLH